MPAARLAYRQFDIAVLVQLLPARSRPVRKTVAGLSGRYVDDFALLSDSKRQLYQWKQAVIAYLQSLRLTVHERGAQVVPVTQGIPWLGFLVFPNYRRVKARKVRDARRRLGERFAAWRHGRISFAEFDAGVQGWINHVRYADSWRLREQVLHGFVWGPEAYR